MTQSAGRFIDVHIIQSLPYSNLNRDDTNSVKTVQYGGVERTRVSSQSWKRATRPDFEKLIGESALRTRRIGERLARELEEARGWPADLARRAGQHLTFGSGIKADPPKAKKDAADDARDWTINAMVYIPSGAIKEFADLADKYREALENAKDAKKPADSVFPTADVQAIIKARNGVINLYGRMLAEVGDAGVDGAVQVAHAFTTHGTTTEIDYFTAVDDITDAWDQTGSAHIGDAEYSAGTFYRYATVDIASLMTNLGGNTDEATKLASAFLQAFIMSLPQAKKTATAPHTVPSLVHLVVRADRPVSYASAFEKPITANRNDNGYDTDSQTRLSQYATALKRFLGDTGVIASGYAAFGNADLNDLGTRTEPIGELIAEAVTHALASPAEDSE